MSEKFNCGFVEGPDGSITWGSGWSEGPYADPEPVVVEYDELHPGVWVPKQVWVRGEHGIDMHDCDWVPSEGCIYHHYAGGGQPYINGYVHAEELPGRIWIADGHHVLDANGDRRPLSDDDLIARGLRRVHGPTPAPFAGAVDGNVSWCEICDAYVDEDETSPCCVCEKDTHIHLGSAVALVDPREGCIDGEAGVYAVLHQPFMTSGLIGCGHFHDDSLARVADLPANVDTSGYAGAPICRSCAPAPAAGPRPMTAYELGLLRRLAEMPGMHLNLRRSERLVGLASRASLVDPPIELARLLEVVRERASTEMDLMQWLCWRRTISGALDKYSDSIRVRG